MKQPLILVLAFAIGIVAGLRSVTAPAVVAWAAKLEWINLEGSVVAFLGSSVAVWIISALAIAELVGDKLPFTPNRIAAGPLIARIVSGAFSAFALCSATGQGAVAGAIVGGIGALAGAFGGFRARRHLVQNKNLPDILVALLEDVIAVGGGLLIVSLL